MCVYFFRKYEMMKVHHREKLGKAKRVHLQELTWRDQKITEQEGELDILTKRLEKVNQWWLMIKDDGETRKEAGYISIIINES